MFFNRITPVAICLLLSVAVIAQQAKEPKIKFGDIKPEDFTKDYKALDSTAEAMYLYDIGSSKHEGNSNGWFSVINKVHQRIILFNKNSFDDLGTVKINLYGEGMNKEKIENLQAATYNLEDGKVVQTKLEKNSVFEDKDGNYKVVKFTFPDLKEGSIIEYTYTINSPYFHLISYMDVPGRIS